jgi:hypothetical protein
MGLRDPRLVNPEARAKREQSVQDKQKRQANKRVGHRPKLRADPNQGQRAKREKAKKGNANHELGTRRAKDEIPRAWRTNLHRRSL